MGTATIFTIIFVATALGIDPSGESEKVISLSQLVPQKVNAWEAAGKDEIYNRDNIFDYINGAGEVYRLYGFRELLVRRFTKSGESDITVEIFDMSTSEDAYGIFSHGREGKEEGIGQGSEYRGGLLCFWKSKFFVCVFAEADTPPTKKTVMNLAEAIDSTIKVKGDKPKLLDYLPEQGLLETSIRYFHSHVSLNYHYYIADKNILNLNQHTQAVLARYQQEKGKCYLLVLQYTNTKESRDAFESFEQIYLPEAKEAKIVQTEDGKWTGADLKGKFVSVVLDAPTRAFAHTLMEKFKEKLEVRQP